MLLSQFIKKRATIFNKKIEYYEDKINYDTICKNLDIPFPKRYFVLNNINDIRKIQLPDNCVIKYNNLQGARGIVFRKNCVFNNNLNLDRVIAFFNNDKRQAKGCQESIKNIKQKIIIEELLNSSEKVLYDIKCFAFKGNVNHVAIINPNNRKETYSFDCNYNRLYYDIRDKNYKDQLIKKPLYFAEIIKHANKMAKMLFPYTFVRIDFYSTTNGPVFGEFTFNPQGGNGFTIKANKLLGKLL